MKKKKRKDSGDNEVSTERKSEYWGKQKEMGGMHENAGK